MLHRAAFLLSRFVSKNIYIKKYAVGQVFSSLTLSPFLIFVFYKLRAQSKPLTRLLGYPSQAHQLQVSLVAFSLILWYQSNIQWLLGNPHQLQCPCLVIAIAHKQNQQRNQLCHLLFSFSAIATWASTVLSKMELNMATFAAVQEHQKSLELNLDCPCQLCCCVSLKPLLTKLHIFK